MPDSWSRVHVVAGAFLIHVLLSGAHAHAQTEPVNVGFLWHMHQPIYIPGENILQTDANGHFSFSVQDVHNQRTGPYTTWPRDAVQSGLSLPHLGAQVSFSGSLIENLNTLEAAGNGNFSNWEGAYKQAANWDTAEGNPRLDMVGFGYHHPLMPLLDERDMRKQIQLHKEIHNQTWGPGVPYSKGIFPAETAFSTRMIPALKAEGLDWAIVDSIHLERAVENYPHTNASNLYAPNRADQINPAIPDEQWVQLNNLWAPSKVAAPFAYRPHNVQHVDPNTGAIEKLVAVPAARYEGNEDGRGGFGALQYEQVFDQYKHLNTDPDHPMFVLLHHDGDNFGGGSESYYHGNFNNMVNWAQSNNDYDVSTVQDYLDRFPVDPNDVVHIEPGSWAGADNGDPEFKKWLGDPDPNTGWSPDRNSWAVLTAAKNHVYTAEDLVGGTDINNILNNTGNGAEKAWHYLVQAQASDHWYWDGTEVWDSNVTRGSNLAIAEADAVLNAHSGAESTAPSVFLPQRESYNPGGFEWDAAPEPSDFEVWTFAYDVSGMQSVQLKWRVDVDGTNPLDSTDNETYAGGDEVGAWNSIDMSSSDVAPPPGILAATARAPKYSAMITGQEDVLIDYYVEAVDAFGNVTRTDIQHVYVGSSSPGGGGADRAAVNPDPVLAGETVTITYDPAGGPLSGASEVYLHYGFDNWATVLPDVQMIWDSSTSLYGVTVPVDTGATLLDFVFNDGAGTWDNNGGADWHYGVTGGNPGGGGFPGFEMDGALDDAAHDLGGSGSQSIYAALDGNQLYVATEDAGEGYDVFLYVAETPGALTAANWAKSGQIAAWDAFLADENDNDYEGWTDATALTEAATGVNGGVLEGVIDLLGELGSMPDEVYVAVGLFQNADGGTLISALQAPGSLDGDGNLDALEYLVINLAELRSDFDFTGGLDADDLDLLFAALAAASTDDRYDVDRDGTLDQSDVDAWLALAGSLRGDADLDGVVAQADLDAVLLNWGQAGTGYAGGDLDGDGVVAQGDLDAVLLNWGSTAESGSDGTSVPEPTVGLLVLAGMTGLARRRR